jgi:sulfatase modifying factor 1
MKGLFTRTALVLLGLGGVVCSCSKPPASTKTGITYNDRKTGGYERFRKTHPSPGPGLIAIEGGTFVEGGSADQDVTYDYNNVRRRVTVASFYMDETEVANQDWLDYLHWISVTYPSDGELYYNALPDTLVWRNPLSYNEPYVDNYLRHPAFQDYPVVGVSWDQVQDYCVWRTDRVNENILRETGRMVAWNDLNGNNKKAKGTAPAPANKDPFNTDIYLNGQYNGPGIDGKKMIPDLSPNAKVTTGANGKAGKEPVRHVRVEDGILKQAYRLPSEAEWEYAALGLIGNTQFENIDDGKIYPWNGLGVRSSKRATRGLILANFKRGAGDYGGVGGDLNDKALITAAVRTYAPNDFGLYNMAGNVNEWVQDTYRQTSFEEVNDFNPFRGNEFSNKRLSDAAKGMYAKDKYGRPIKDPSVSPKKQKYADYLAQQQAANLNPNQPNTATSGAAVGANDSVFKSKFPTVATQDPLAGKKYQPDGRGAADTVNTSLYGNTTLANDHSKVYKGGAWNDMAFWLNPATRRFMDEDASSADLGFRCAMTLVGEPEVHPEGKPHFAIKNSKPFNAKQ